MEQKDSIGVKIATLRRTHGCTQAQLGEYLNISYQAVSKWEREESCPDFDTLSKIAQYFNVPITYFEKGSGEEVAASAAPATVEEKPVEKTPVREMLGVCKDCGKVVYAGDEGATSPALICKTCETNRVRAEQRKREAERKEQERKRKEAAYAAAAKKDAIQRSRNKGLIWGAVLAGILLIIGVVSSFSKEGASEILGAIGGIAVFSVFVFAFVAQLFWDGAVVDCVLAGGKVIGTPGIIFSFDLDGFIFLIVMKVLFAVLRMIVFLITALVCVIAGIVIAPFTFFPALHRVNSGDLV